MDYNEVLQAIGSVGFPIVMCFVLIKYQQTTLDMLKTSIDKLSDMINELKDKLEKLER